MNPPGQFLGREDAPWLRPRDVNNRSRARLESIPSIERDPEWLIAVAIAANEAAAQFGKRRIEEAYGGPPSPDPPGRAGDHSVPESSDGVVEEATLPRSARGTRTQPGLRTGAGRA